MCFDFVRREINNINQLSFSGGFEFKTDDYNDDEDLDFLLGQIIDTQHGLYEFFSISRYGHIYKAECEDELLAAQSNPSIQLEMEEQNWIIAEL